ncbi:META domain-containing protein [Candidatus Parcubacteria bacterium]|nr:META domain-containing protein [Candidatus Parcubacteria bacterium]
MSRTKIMQILKNKTAVIGAIFVLVLVVIAAVFVMKKVHAPEVVGVYTASVVSAGPARNLTLTLSADQLATLVTDYSNNNVVTEQGTWSAEGKTQVRLSLTANNIRGYSSPVVIVFERSRNSLEAIEYDESLYGSEGLTLVRAGEAVDERLTKSSWQWKETVYSNDETVRPKNPAQFQLTLGEDGRFSAMTDCNNLLGTYDADGSEVEFEDIASTKKYCEGSQEAAFTTMLSQAQGYLFNSAGHLVLVMRLDSGSIIFTPR